jgi:hypothetical protein
MFSDHHKIFSQAQISSISISYIIDTIKHQREKKCWVSWSRNYKDATIRISLKGTTQLQCSQVTAALIASLGMQGIMSVGRANL